MARTSRTNPIERLEQYVRREHMVEQLAFAIRGFRDDMRREGVADPVALLLDQADPLGRWLAEGICGDLGPVYAPPGGEGRRRTPVAVLCFPRQMVVDLVEATMPGDGPRVADHLVGQGETVVVIAGGGMDVFRVTDVDPEGPRDREDA
jgi:hypothetical protein